MRIPRFNLSNTDFPFAFSNGFLEINFPDSYLAEPINAELYKYEGKIRDTELEKIDLDSLAFSFREGGFLLRGNIRVRLRKLLWEVPIIGAAYTPWVQMSASFVEELAVNVVDRRLNIVHYQLCLNSPESLKKIALDKFVLPYFKEKVIGGINDIILDFNGVNLEELILKYSSTKFK